MFLLRERGKMGQLRGKLSAIIGRTDRGKEDGTRSDGMSVCKSFSAGWHAFTPAAVREYA